MRCGQPHWWTWCSFKIKESALGQRTDNHNKWKSCRTFRNARHSRSQWLFCCSFRKDTLCTRYSPSWDMTRWLWRRSSRARWRSLESGWKKHLDPLTLSPKPRPSNSICCKNLRWSAPAPPFSPPICMVLEIESGSTPHPTESNQPRSACASGMSGLRAREDPEADSDLPFNRMNKWN